LFINVLRQQKPGECGALLAVQLTVVTTRTNWFSELGENVSDKFRQRFLQRKCNAGSKYTNYEDAFCFVCEPQNEHFRDAECCR
jgi:hypothetical protein